MDTTENRPTRKATYLDRKRRKRAVASHAEDSSSEAEASVGSDFEPTTMENAPVTTPKKAVNKTPARKSVKKTDVDPPRSPSPTKRAGRDAVDAEVPASAKKTHTSGQTSITSLKEVALNVGESPSSVKKPLLTSGKEDDSPVAPKKPTRSRKKKIEVAEGAPPKPVSVAKSVISEAALDDKQESVSDAPTKKTRAKRKGKSVIADDDDDAASVADSTISNVRIRRNEGERIAYFKNQPECSSLEPYSVLCMKCNKSINLGKKQTYAVRPWEIHRARCDAIPGQEMPATPAPVTKPVSVASAVPVTPISAAFKVPVATPSSVRRLTEAERKEFLQSDKQVKQLEESRVMCARCDQWIPLSDANAYITSNWTKHKLRCSDAMPSNRVAAAKRKLLLVNDNQVQKFTTQSVLCKNCGVNLSLTGEGDYNLTAWNEHKVECLKSILFPSRVSIPRPLSASASLSTFVPDNTPVASSPQGLKRSREEDDSVAVEEERPAARPRTEGYVPTQAEPSNSLLGWFMTPIHSFVRGFKESLRDKS